jgi:hypothetical protein
LRLLNKKLKILNLDVPTINPSAGYPRLLSDRIEDEYNEGYWRLSECQDFHPDFLG